MGEIKRWVKIGADFYRLKGEEPDFYIADTKRFTEEELKDAYYYDELARNDAALYWYRKFKNADYAAKKYEEKELERKMKRQGRLLNKAKKQLSKLLIWNKNSK